MVSWMRFRTRVMEEEQKAGVASFSTFMLALAVKAERVMLKKELKRNRRGHRRRTEGSSA